MATLELVEKLRNYGNVTYQQANEALDACNNDILDAIVYLEKKGFIQRPSETQEPSAHYSTEHTNQNANQAFTAVPPTEETFGSMMKRFGKWLRKIFNQSLVNHFTVLRGGEVSFSVPIIILVICLLFSFGTVFILMIVGLFFGFSYSFDGKNYSQNSTINKAMDSVARATDDIKKSVQNTGKTNENNQTSDFGSTNSNDFDSNDFDNKE